jgi:hypothetical protein
MVILKSQSETSVSFDRAYDRGVIRGVLIGKAVKDAVIKIARSALIPAVRSAIYVSGVVKGCVIAGKL